MKSLTIPLLFLSTAFGAASLTLYERKEALETQVETLTERLARWIAYAGLRDAELAFIKTEQLPQLVAAVGAEARKVADLTAQVERAESAIAEAKATIASVEQQRDAARADADAGQATITTLQTQLTELKERLTGLDQQLATTEAALIQARRDRDAAIANGQATQIALDGTIQQLEQKKTDLAQTAAAVVTLSRDLTERLEQVAQHTETTVALTSRTIADAVCPPVAFPTTERGLACREEVFNALAKVTAPLAECWKHGHDGDFRVVTVRSFSQTGHKLFQTNKGTVYAETCDDPVVDVAFEGVDGRWVGGASPGLTVLGRKLQDVAGELPDGPTAGRGGLPGLPKPPTVSFR